MSGHATERARPRETFRRMRLTLCVYALWAAAYEAVGSYASALPASDLSLPLDALIPFVPQWVFVYQLTYVLPFAAIFAIEDAGRFDRAVLAIGCAAALAFIVYVALPVSFTQPALGHGLAARMLALERGLDSARANHLPSLHVANVFILYLSVRKQRLGRNGDRLALGLAFAIAVATLVVKQHILLDVLAGVSLAPLAWHAARWIEPGVRRPRRLSADTPTPTPALHAKRRWP
jgi:membrane-associated phospholipid phosphatase